MTQLYGSMPATSIGLATDDPWASPFSGRAAWTRPYGRLLGERLRDGALLDVLRLGWTFAQDPRGCITWLSRLDLICARASNAPTPFDLARKPGRLFVVAGMTAPERINLLTSHYAHLLAAFGAGRVRRLLNAETLVLATLTGRSESAYKLCAQRPHHNGQEGELELVLNTAEGLTVARLDLAVGSVREGSLRYLWIGGLQGCSAPDSKAVTVTVTKDLHGLRPKDLLVHAAYALSEVFNVDAIKAVTNDGHVHAKRRNARLWTADYDAFWRDLGGEADGSGMMILPKVRSRRNPEEVPSSKRKAWLSRYAIVDALDEAVKLSAGDGVPPGAIRPAKMGLKPRRDEAAKELATGSKSQGPSQELSESAAPLSARR